MPIQHFPESHRLKSPSPLKRREAGWQVVLGRLAWSRHTYERQPGNALKLLGSVSKGMQTGALAMTAEDQYVQVVGDHITPLNTRAIAKALASAPKASAAFDPGFSRASPPRLVGRQDTTAPVVVVKKRRVILQLDASSIRPVR
jgi:hypothetical protein